MKKALLALTVLIAAIAISCNSESVHTHVWDDGTPLDSQATILKKGRMKYRCTICDQTKTENGFRTVKGYWKSQQNKYTNSRDTDCTETLYLSLDGNGDGKLDRFELKSGAEAYSGVRLALSYKWITPDDNPDKRTHMDISMLEVSEIGYNIVTYRCSAAEGVDDKGNDTLTITAEGGKTLFSDNKTNKMYFTRTEKAPHTHSGTVTKPDGIYQILTGTAHWVDTDCGESHPKVNKFVEWHTYDGTDTLGVETCSKCGLERLYHILLYKDGEGESHSYEMATKKKGFLLSETVSYTKYDTEKKKEEVVTISVASWKTKDGQELRIGDTYYPQKEPVELVYTEKSK